MEKEERLVEKVGRVLTKYCPYTDDRLDLIDSDNRPEFDVHIYLGKDLSQVYFVYGNPRAKVSVDNCITIPRTVGLDEIEELMDFIKADHDHIIFDKHDIYRNVAEFKFDIRWGGDESIKGINCGAIGVVLNFRSNPELEKKYLYFINEKYFESKDLWSKWEFTDSVFASYVDSLEKEGLIKFLSDLDPELLRKIMKTNTRDIIESSKDNPKIKELFK